MTLGIILGLLAALFQAFSYIFSRLFTGRFNTSARTLLVVSHLTMGVFSLALLPVFMPAEMPPFTAYAIPLFLCAFAYFGGQACLFVALQRAHASRVSPLLGLKILILALISSAFFAETFSVLQWVAVAASVLAALMLRKSGEKLAWPVFLWVLGACFGYSISDLSIAFLVKEFMDAGLLRATITSVCMVYIICAMFSAALLRSIPLPSLKMFVAALPFSVMWFGAMLLLFACFAVAGVVFGNIVQSTRGILSVLLGAMLAHAGFRELESHAPADVLVRRILAAVLMTLAIVLFQTAR